MGKYLDIARKAIEDYRQEQAKRQSVQRKEKIVEIEEIVLQHYSDGLKGEAESLDKLINDLELWNPYFSAQRDVIEEAVWAAAQRLAERESYSGAANESPGHRKPYETVDELVEARNADVNRTGVEADNKEMYDSESVPEESLEEKLTGCDLHGDISSEQDQIVRVAEVFRQHPDRLTWDVSNLLNEGFFNDKLDFYPTPYVVEEAQCMLMLPAE